jgi:hypothetical protein
VTAPLTAAEKATFRSACHHLDGAGGVRRAIERQEAVRAGFLDASCDARVATI